MTEGHTDRPSRWPTPGPAAEKKAADARENLTEAHTGQTDAHTGQDRPETAATSTRTDSVPNTAGETAHAPAPEQASPAHAEPSTWLFEPAHAEEFRRRWDAIKASFVDDPREAVRRADELTDELMRELTAAVESRRHNLAEHWQGARPADGDGDKAETERLRVALHDYRNMLDPILRV